MSKVRINSLTETDKMQPGLRECVHEFGFAIVQACLQAKVRDPQMIRQLVREIWEGARQPSQRRPTAGTLDWLLIQAGCEISSATLFRVLANCNLAVVPMEPTKAMIDASLAEVSGFKERMTKFEKHRRRLRVALRAGMYAKICDNLKEAG